MTIATNMAGRGVDILLGGNPEYLAREQLKKSGVDPAKATPEQYEKALADVTAGHPGGARGRRRPRRASTSSAPSATRPGASTTSSAAAPAARATPARRASTSRLEDDLMRIFGSERISGLMARIGMGDGVPIEHGMITRAIERAQKQVEGQNFTIRKHLLEYDDVMNKQRETIYSQRRKILKGEDQREYFLGLIDNLVDWMLDTHANKDASPEDWDRDGLAPGRPGPVRAGHRDARHRLGHGRPRRAPGAPSPRASSRSTRTRSGSSARSCASSSG